MASYKAWLKRKENATPYANEANAARNPLTLAMGSRAADQSTIS